MSRKTYPQEVEAEELLLEELSDEVETVSEPIQAVVVPEEPTAELLAYAKQLQGFAAEYNFSDTVTEQLIALGLAAKTEEGLVRGYKFFNYFK